MHNLASVNFLANACSEYPKSMVAAARLHWESGTAYKAARPIKLTAFREEAWERDAGKKGWHTLVYVYRYNESVDT